MPCPPAGRAVGNIFIDMFGKFLLYKKNGGDPLRVRIDAHVVVGLKSFLSLLYNAERFI